jgi:hypothetical protein
MVREGASPAARMGFGSTAAAMAKPLSQFLHKRETDTETRRNGRLRGSPGGKGINNAITAVLRGGLHSGRCALHGPDRQLPPALKCGNVDVPAPFPSCLVVWGGSDEVITAIQAALPEAWLSSH